MPFIYENRADSKNDPSLPVSSALAKTTNLDVVAQAKLGFYNLKDPSDQQVIFDHFIQAYLSGKLPQWTEHHINYFISISGDRLHTIFGISKDKIQGARDSLLTSRPHIFDMMTEKNSLNFFVTTLMPAVQVFDFKESFLEYVSKEDSILSQGICYGLSVSFILDSFSGKPSLFYPMLALLFKFFNSKKKEALISEEMKSVDAFLHQMIAIQEQMNISKNRHMIANLLPEHVDYRTKYIDFSALEMDAFLQDLEGIEGVKYLLFSKNHVITFYFDSTGMYLLDQTIHFLFYKVFLRKNRLRVLYNYLYSKKEPTDFRFIGCVMAVYPKEMQDTLSPLFPCKESFSNHFYDGLLKSHSDDSNYFSEVRYHVRDWTAVIRNEYMNMKYRQAEKGNDSIDEYFLNVLRSDLHRSKICIEEIQSDAQLLEALRPYWREIMSHLCENPNRYHISLMRYLDSYEDTFVLKLFETLITEGTQLNEEICDTFLEKLDAMNSLGLDNYYAVLLNRVLRKHHSLYLVNRLIEKIKLEDIDYRDAQGFTALLLFPEFCSRNYEAFFLSFCKIGATFKTLLEKGANPYISSEKGNLESIFTPCTSNYAVSLSERTVNSIYRRRERS